MFSRDLWSEIFHSIKSNKLRTFLTGFSVAWGIFILVLLLASVDGMQNGFMKQFGDDATNSIIIYPSTTTKAYGGFEKGRRIQLENEDVDFIKGSFPGYFEYISPSLSKSVDARHLSERGNYQVNAVNPQNKFIEKVTIEKGRYINGNDMINTSKVVVLGKVCAQEVFKDEDRIGKNLVLNGLSYRVVGVFSDDGNERSERNMLAPISTFQRLYSNTTDVDRISLTYNPTFNYAEAINFSDILE